MVRWFSACLPFAALFALAGCGGAEDEGAVEIALIGQPEMLTQRGLRLSPPAQQVRAATVEGLVALNETGEVVPALAERWIVTDDGLSYIFRLRNSEWPGGEAMSAGQVRDALRGAIRELGGTSLALDLAPLSEIRAMTGRVIEFRLSSPMPDFLQLLAQPELGVLHKGRGSGPMALERRQQGAWLSLLPPEARGLPIRANWREDTRILGVRALSARAAVAAFQDDAVDLVLGGTLADLPLADIGPLSRGTVRLDAAQGLFGLRVLRAEGLLADPERREALAMAIERENLLVAFNIAGWMPSTRLVPTEAAAGAPERWPGQPIEQRRAQASRRVAGFAGDKVLRIDLPQGVGSDLVLRKLAADWQAIGVRLVRARGGEQADLELVDVLARFGGRRWYLNQFACRVRRALCSPEADELVRQAVRQRDPVARETMLAEAEARLVAKQAYIPLGSPVRWSLVRGQIEGFAENRWAVHPLHPLALAPT